MNVGLDARKLRDGGIGTYIRNLVAALLDAPGDERYVAFVSPADAGRLADVGRPAEAERLAGARRIAEEERLPERQSLAAAPGRLSEVVVRAGKYTLAEHWVLARAARRAALDLFHAPHYTLPLAWRGPAVVTIHDLIHVRHARFFPPGAGQYARAVAGAAAKRARIVLANSEHTRAEVITLLGAPPGRVRVVPLAAAPGLAPRPRAAVEAFRRARALPAGYVLYVGARKRHKNLALLVAALGAMAPGTRPPLVLSGERWRERDALAAAARRAGLAGAVHFSGPLAGDDELALLYSGAALYAQPSLAEGFGLPPLEAMACGTPVIASTAGALPEVLGDAAPMLPPEDPAAWAATMERMLGDEAWRSALVRRGAERARLYSWARTAALTRQAYLEATNA